MSTVIKCIKCGKAIPEGETSCPVCGTSSPRIKKLSIKRNEAVASLRLLTSAFTDCTVFYDSPPVYSELLIALLPVGTFFLIFLHIGIDKAILSYIDIPMVLLWMCLGVAYGIGSVLLMSSFAMLTSFLSKDKPHVSFLSAVRALGMSYCVPLAVELIGLIFRFVFSWSSLTFSIAALLLMLYPFFTLLVKFVKNRLYAFISVSVTGFLLCLAVMPFLNKKFL